MKAKEEQEPTGSSGLFVQSNEGKTSPKCVCRGWSNYPPYPMAVPPFQTHEYCHGKQAEVEGCVAGDESEKEPEEYTKQTSNWLALLVSLHSCTCFLLHALYVGLESVFPIFLSPLISDLRRIDHDPVDEHINDLLPCVCEHFRSREISVFHGHLVAQQSCLSGQADVSDDIDDDGRIETGTDQPGFLCLH